MMISIAIVLLVSSSCEGLVRQAVDGEIRPLSVSQSSTLSNNEARFGADNAIDMDFNTMSYTNGNPSPSWLKATLDGVHCIDYVKQFSGSGGNSNFRNTYTCTQDGCTCKGCCCNWWSLSVYLEDGTEPGHDVPSGCKVGDTLKIQTHGSSNILYMYELVIVPKEKVDTCSEFTVANGRLDIKKNPYSPNDNVRVFCATDYIPEGTNPRKCGDDGWESDAPTCIKNAGGGCVPLFPPVHGILYCDDSLVAGAKCTAACSPDYLTVSGSSPTEVTCVDEKFLWSHQNKENPLGMFPPCTAMIEPVEKKLTTKAHFQQYYCNTPDEQAKIYTALQSYLEDTLSIKCLSNGKCVTEGLGCTLADDKTSFTVTFDLVQKLEMLKSDVLNEAQKSIEDAAETFSLSIPDNDGNKRKKRAVFSASSVETEQTVECSSGQVVKDGVCVSCPAGYKMVFVSNQATCVPCEVGTYNPEEDQSECKKCGSGTTTYGTGSTSSEQCIELCTVPEIPNGKLNKEKGFKVEPTYSLILTCDSTHEASVVDFQCSSYDQSQHKCNLVVDIVDCTGEKMTLTLGKSGGSYASIHLLKSGTGCEFKGTETVITTKIHECGTIPSHNDTHVIYQNKITAIANKKDHDNGITRGDKEVPFECAYERTGKTGIVYWETTGETVVESVNGEGTFVFHLDLFEKAEFAKKVDKFPVELTLEDDLFVQVSVESADPDLTLGLVHLKAKDTPKEDDATYEYDLVEDGCKKDSTLQPIDVVPADSKKARLSFQAFKFLESQSAIYLHAEVKVCGKSDDSCTNICKETKRKRRSTDAADKEEQYHVFLGPFVAADPVKMNAVASVSKELIYNSFLLAGTVLLLVMRY